MREDTKSPIAFLAGPAGQVLGNVRRNWCTLGTQARQVLIRDPSPRSGFTMSVRDPRPLDTLRRGPSPAPFAAVTSGNVAGSVITSGISSTLSLYKSAIIVRILLGWFQDQPAFIARPLSTITDPYLNLFRGIIPPLGGIDLSPILAFVLLDVFSGSAASLSAEIPDDLRPRSGSASKVPQSPPAADS